MLFRNHSPNVYTKLSRNHCFKNRYKAFPNIEAAKKSCSEDSNCKGFYDQECDSGYDDIYLCPDAVTYEKSHCGSCVYEKNAGNTDGHVGKSSYKH